MSKRSWRKVLGMYATDSRRSLARRLARCTGPEPEVAWVDASTFADAAEISIDALFIDAFTASNGTRLERLEDNH